MSKIGFVLVIVAIAFAVFTSNLVLSEKEKNLAQQFRMTKKSGVEPNDEMKHAFVNWIIAIGCRALFGLGLALCTIGFII